MGVFEKKQHAEVYLEQIISKLEQDDEKAKNIIALEVIEIGDYIKKNQDGDL